MKRNASGKWELSNSEVMRLASYAAKAGIAYQGEGAAVSAAKAFATFDEIIGEMKREGAVRV